MFLVLSLERQVVVLAHIEIEIDWVERNERCEQGCRAGACATACNQAADRELTCTNASCKWCRHFRVFQIELGGSDSRLCVLNGRLGGLLFGNALVNGFLRRKPILPKRLRPLQLV